MVPDLRFYVFMTAVILPVYHAEATPNASITPAPQFPPSLFARQDSGDIGPNVYGYINGDISKFDQTCNILRCINGCTDSPLGCGAGYQFDKSDSIGGCCNEATCTSLYFTCVNKGDPDPCGGESSYLCALGAAAITALSWYVGFRQAAHPDSLPIRTSLRTNTRLAMRPIRPATSTW